MERIGVVPGTEIGGYEVLGPLGQGGMGAVYRAIDGDGRTVALKLLHPHLGADPDARERLSREVANLQRVRHPGVARVLDAEIDSTDAFVVTELVEGADLAAHVRRDGPLEPAELADLATQLQAALTVVHRAGVLHRDLSPGNVMLTPSGAVLIDFGIAQAADDARVTSTGLVSGTPGYLSPELLEGGEPGPEADWWGWAALLGFAATGRPPFGVRPVQAVLAKVRAGEADLVGLDPRTTAALRSALAVDPEQRMAPDDVVAELRLAAQGDTEPDEADDEADDEAGQGLVAEPVGAGTTQVLGAAGSTRLMPVADGDPGERTDQYADGFLDQDDDEYDDEYDGAYDGEHGPDDLDEPGAVDPAVAIEPYLAPQPRRRPGTVLAVGAALLAAGALRPGVALALAVGLALLARTVGLAVRAVHVRRARRGVRRGDSTWAVLGSPWYLLRGVLGVLPAALVATSVVVVLGGVGWWLIDSGRLVVAEPVPGESAGELAGNAAWVTPMLLTGAVLAGLVTLWFGPMSRTTRVGARWALSSVAPGRAGALAVTLVALGAAVALTALVVLGHETVWWPLPGPPDLR